MSTRSGPFRTAFSLLEVMVVCVIVGILAAIVIPQFGGVTEDAKTSAAQSSTGAVRSAIAGFRAKNILQGGVAYPTLTQLTTMGTVLQGEMPANPFNNKNNVQAVTRSQAESRTVINEATVGWNYFVDNAANPPAAIFYLNSDDVTTLSNGSGSVKAANQL